MGLIYTDIPELEGSDTEIVLSNMAQLEAQFSRIVEKRLAHIGELSDSVINDGEDSDIIKSILLSTRSDGESCDGQVIAQNKENADIIYSQVSLCERLILYRQISERYIAQNKESLWQKYSSSKGRAKNNACGKIAYVKNPNNDRAYLKLSSVIKSPKAVYCESADEACIAACDGECEFCILPVEASSSKLAVFYENIIKYGLVKLCEHRISTSDGETTYALLHKENILPTKEKISRAKATYIELLLDSDEIALSDLLLSGEFCRMSVKRIDTLNKRTCITFKADRADFDTFMTYLSLDCPGIVILGIYKQI